MRALQIVRARTLIPALILGSSSIAGAQLANASTAATGLSGAYTARAQGYNAVAWNPANLAMPGNPGFSFTLLALDGTAGIKPIDLNKLAPYTKKCPSPRTSSCNFIPRSVREEWMLDVIADSGQKGATGGGITELAFSLGSLGFQFNTKVATDMNLAPDAVEAILFANKGRDTTTIHNFNFAGSRLQAAAYSTGAVGYGMSLPLIPLPNFAVGATVKYTVGHGMVLGLDGGSALDSAVGNVNFPAVLPDSASLKSANIGSGVGLDLGAAWTIPGFRFGVSVQNVVNTFKWDTTKFVSRSAIALFRSDTTFSQVDTVDKPYANAPAALRSKLAALRFKPVMSAGVAFDWIPAVTVSADVRQQVGDGIEVGPKSMLAAGAELHLIPFIPLRAGVSAMTGGFGVSGGVGVHFLGFEMGVAGFLRKRDGGTESGGTLNLISIRP